MLIQNWVVYTQRGVCVRLWVSSALIHRVKFVGVGFRLLIHGVKFVLGFGWADIYRGKFVLGFGLLIHGVKFVLGFG